MTAASPRPPVPPILEPLAQRVVPMWRDWWLGCEAGWHPLLARLGVDLDKIAPSWSLVQAKNKYGALRLYAASHSADPQVVSRFADRIASAEKEASKTCERCGSPGQLHVDSAGWHEVLCGLCWTGDRDD